MNPALIRNRARVAARCAVKPPAVVLRSPPLPPLGAAQHRAARNCLRVTNHTGGAWLPVRCAPRSSLLVCAPP